MLSRKQQLQASTNSFVFVKKPKKGGIGDQVTTYSSSASNHSGKLIVIDS